MASQLHADIAGDQGNQWLMAKADLTSGKFQLTIEATVGDGDRGDIAIDDPAIFSRSCRGVTEDLNAYAFATLLPVMFEYLDRTGLDVRMLETWPGQQHMGFRWKDWVCYGLDMEKEEIFEMLKKEKMLKKKRAQMCSCRSTEDLMKEMMMTKKMASPFQCTQEQTCGNGDDDRPEGTDPDTEVTTRKATTTTTPRPTTTTTTPRPTTTTPSLSAGNNRLLTNTKC